MIDGIQISKTIDKQQIIYKNLDHISSGPYGDRFKLKTSSNTKYTGNTPVVTITSNNKLIVKGSLPYLFNDSNLFPFSLEEVKESFNDLSYRLGIDLSDAVVNNFEFGVAVITPFSFKEFVHHHTSLPKMDSSYYSGKGKYFHDKVKNIKLSDAGRNAKYKLSQQVRQSLIKSKQYNRNAHYVKFEIQYKSPLRYFGQIVTVRDLIDVDFLSVCARDLLDTYRKIGKTGFKIPDSAKELTTSKILAISLKEMEQLTGHEVEKRVEEKMKTLNLLKSWQKYDRRKSIKKAFDGISINSPNPYDITYLLEEATEKFLQSVVY